MVHLRLRYLCATLLVLISAGSGGAVVAPAISDVQPTDPLVVEPSVASTRATENASANVSAWIAPRSASGDLTSLRAIADRRRNGSLTRSGTIAVGDTLVIELAGTDLGPALDGTDSTRNATRRFERLLAENDTTFRFFQINSPPERRGKYVFPSLSNLVVVPDARNDTYYVVVDTAELRGTRDFEDGERPTGDDRVGSGEEYQLEFALRGTRQVPLDRADRPDAGVEIEFVEREAGIGGIEVYDRMFVAPRTNYAVAGSTTLAPGSTVIVAVAGPDIDRSNRVSVRRSGSTSRFETTFDFDGLKRGATVDISVRDDGRTIDRIEGVVSERTASVRLPEREDWGDETIVVEEVTVSDGGFVVVRGGATDGPVLGNTGYLPPGTHTNVPVRVDTYGFHRIVRWVRESAVAVAHPDTDGDERFDFPDGDTPPYSVNGSYAVDSVPIADPDGSADPLPPLTPSPTTEAAMTTEPAGTATLSPESTRPTTTEPSTGQSGFGFGVAVAVLAGALLVLRRTR